MGSNSSATHVSYVISPTAGLTDGPVAAAPQTAVEAGLDDAESSLELAKVIAAGGYDPDDPFGPPVVDLPVDDLPAQYAEFVEFIKEAQLQGGVAEQQGADVTKFNAELWETTNTFLTRLSEEELQELAAANGFEHPEQMDQSALLIWLHPLVDDDAPAKAMVQAKAQELYEKMCAAGAVSGATDLPAGPGSGAPVAGGWVATPADLQQAYATVGVLAGEFQTQLADKQALAALIGAENHLFTATCPGHETGLAGLQVKAREHVTQVLAGGDLPGHQELAEEAWKSGELTAHEANLLSPLETMAVLRTSTPAAERQALNEIAEKRGAQVASLVSASEALGSYQPHQAGPLDLPELGTDADAATTMASFSDAAAAFCAAKQDVATWQDSVPKMAGGWPGSSDQFTGDFQTWAKQQKLADLRKAASAMGLEHAGKATRAQVQNWIAAGWDSSHSKADLQAAIAAKAAGSTAAGPAGTPASASAGYAKPAAANAGTSGTSSKTSPGPSPKAKTSKTSAETSAGTTSGTSSNPKVSSGDAAGFVAKHRGLVEALQQAKGTAADLPPRHDPAAVASWDFGPGKEAALGGMHAKTLHQAPDGSTWMFKPDKHEKGARAHAEAAASQIFHAAGVASVPLYVTEINGKKGSIQPLIKGATHLSGGPSSWSQAEVDAIVRYHVAAWAVGDHDGKSDNILRTPSGGIVPIDQGQAFKFYGTDNLSVDYHPNSSFGAERPVFQQAYTAHLAGKLGKGVKINPAVAHPVISKFESIPDTQWRAMLYSTAHEGAKHGVAWVPHMRKRAAAKHKIPETKVSPGRVAEAFLDHACERKKGLRQAFSAFFTGELKLASGTVVKHGGPDHGQQLQDRPRHLHDRAHRAGRDRSRSGGDLTP